MAEEKRRPGRPKIESPKSKNFTVRMSETTYQKLKDLSSEQGLTIAEIINEGIELVYQSRNM